MLKEDSNLSARSSVSQAITRYVLVTLELVIAIQVTESISTEELYCCHLALPQK